MPQQIDERQARKRYVRHRQTVVFSITGVIVAATLVVALLFNFHVGGLGLVATPLAEPNFGNPAPCAVKDNSGKATYVPNGSVNVRVLNGTSHVQFASAVSKALAKRGFAMQEAGNFSSTSVERTTVYFGKNAINQAYTVAGNFTDATMVMIQRDDQLVDVVLGATFSDLNDEKQSPQQGKEITDIQGCQAADKMTDLPADVKPANTNQQ